MLLLTRKVGESITIGDTIKITVIAVEGGQVRLGIEAPSEVIVHRSEIYQKIQEENRKAARGTRVDLIKVAARWKQWKTAKADQ